jgi:hypothetical protein
MCAVCADHNVVDVELLSLLLCMHLWLQILPSCQNSCAVNWFVYVDIIEINDMWIRKLPSIVLLPIMFYF